MKGPMNHSNSAFVNANDLPGLILRLKPPSFLPFTLSLSSILMLF